MSIIETTWSVVNQFTDKPFYVEIDSLAAQNVALSVMESKTNTQEFFVGKPKWMNGEWICSSPNLWNEKYYIITYELILDSINYNFWYGKNDIRPNKASSYQASKLLDDAFKQAIYYCSGTYKAVCRQAIYNFKNALIVNRYPNLENRLKHLSDLLETFGEAHGTSDGWINMMIRSIEMEQEDAEIVLHNLITTYPGYASDMFLKRAFLFIIEMNRRMGWFKKDIAKIPVPADYQIPKVLKHFGVLKYNEELISHINNHRLIPSGSLMECEIRASTIKACKIIADGANCTMGEVDAFLFANRKNCKDPFHLTITTDY